jgi:hypothetical protein
VDSKTSSASVDCTEGATTDIEFNGMVIGTITASDASSDLEVSFDLTAGEYFLLSDSVWAGDCQAPTFVHGDLFYADAEVRDHSFSIDLANLPECGCVKGKAEIGFYNARTSSVDIYVIEHSIEYCKCPDEDLKTVTQGGWGAKPAGENNGTYLHANFAGAFPSGVVVGCDNTITLTSAQAVTDFLPNTGTPAALTQDYLNSGAAPGNTLAGQVVALALNIGFDDYDADFGDASSSLSDAVITSGAFAGWTVGQVFEEAQKVLGGCDSEYDADEMNEVTTDINEAFDNGGDTGFLDVQ